MATLTLSEEQVIELVRQLSPEGKEAVLQALAAEPDQWWQETLDQGENEMRRLSAERGASWDTMLEEERERFVDQLLHVQGLAVEQA